MYWYVGEQPASTYKECRAKHLMTSSLDKQQHMRLKLHYKVNLELRTNFKCI